jgi:hypothetical protein
MNGIPPKIHRTKRLWLIMAITIAGLFLITLGCGEYKGGGSSSGEIGSIKLAWDPSTDPNMAGYKVYCGLKKEIRNYP